MTTIRIPITQFKAQCTKLLREVAAGKQAIEVTNHGNVLAVVEPPARKSAKDPTEIINSLAGSAKHVGDIISPMPPDTWKAKR